MRHHAAHHTAGSHEDIMKWHEIKLNKHTNASIDEVDHRPVHTTSASRHQITPHVRVKSMSKGRIEPNRSTYYGKTYGVHSGAKHLILSKRVLVIFAMRVIVVVGHWSIILLFERGLLIYCRVFGAGLRVIHSGVSLSPFILILEC
jgi:hypothetical protein